MRRNRRAANSVSRRSRRSLAIRKPAKLSVRPASGPTRTDSVLSPEVTEDLVEPEDRLLVPAPTPDGPALDDGQVVQAEGNVGPRELGFGHYESSMSTCSM